MSSSVKPASSYRVAFATVPEARDNAVAIWEMGGLAAPGTTEFALGRYDWFYAGNPAGAADVNLLYSEKEIPPIGTLGVGRRLLMVGSRPVKAGVLVDFAVVPSHRSVFPALLLQRTARARALKSVEVLLGLPDTKAVALCRRLESHVSGEMRQYTRVVRSRAYLERVMPTWVSLPLSKALDTADSLLTRLRTRLAGVRSEWVSGFDEDFDDLWQALPKEALILGIRDRAFLRWRFGEQPGHDYVTLKVMRTGAAGLLGYLVCEIGDGRLTIKDLLVADAKDLAACLLEVITRARDLGLRSVETQLLASEAHYRGLQRAGFSLRGTRPFFAVLSEHLQGTIPRAIWYVTQADEDV